jgi:hypothetical protein
VVSAPDAVATDQWSPENGQYQTPPEIEAGSRHENYVKKFD